MRIFNNGTLGAWIERHARAATGLTVWKHVIEKAAWKTPSDMLDSLPCDIIRVKPAAQLPEGLIRVVFDISGNRFRLMAHVSFARQHVFLKWFGTHAEYDKIDFTTLKVEEKP